MKPFLRMKQIADQTFSSRSGKLDSEIISEELQLADRKVEQLKMAIHLLCKKLMPPNGNITTQDPGWKEKRLKKIPEYNLGMMLTEDKTFEDRTLFNTILQYCGSTEITLAKYITDRDMEIEQGVFDPFNIIDTEEIPNINKSKKAFLRLVSEKESANNRYQSLRRQANENPNFQQSKIIDAKEELESVEMRLEQAKDTLAADMFSLLAKEMDFAKTMLQYLKFQRGYHENAMYTLTDIIPELEKQISKLEN